MSADSECHEFASEAMNTQFKISIADRDIDPKYAAQAAAAAFRELALIKSHLSKYEESSDISQINSLAAGESVVVDPDTFECLKIALKLTGDTNGVFDVAFGSNTENTSARLFEIGSKKLVVTALRDGLEIDLGGIGKGYALDRMAGLLNEWGIESALLRASFSTVRAMGAPPDKAGWEVGFGPRNGRSELLLRDNALSGSGIEVQGSHVRDPRKKDGKDGSSRYRTWALAPTGAIADGLSTAFMIMDENAILNYLDNHPQASAWIQPDKEDLPRKIEPG